MSDIIQLLPDSVANQIAAGEVIQRPASVIKELVENAVDAGAKTVNVLVVDAGRTSIQVIDDGCGMSDTDARLSFERHATSKIRDAADLFSLHTMGFRGEALASIAAVAQVELKTRKDGEEVGTSLSISGSKFMGQDPVSCPVGSNFLIENLFFNVPARRKFLKSNQTELNNIITAFERIVLVYPQISFTLHSNQVELMNLRAGNLRQRIIDVFGKRLNQNLLPVGVETTLCKISGFVGKPESARKKTPHQYFFVNGRYMKHPYFNKAVMMAFDRLIMAGEQVPYFIYFDVNPEDIDVNIHPTKTEIKFENEQEIWQILSAAVKDAVGRFNDVPSIDFDTQGCPDIPVFNPQTGTEAPKLNFNPQYNPFKETPSSSIPSTPHIPKQPSVEGWEQIYEGLESQDVPQEQGMFDAPSVHAQEETVIAEKSPTHYQYKGTYIMTAVKSGLMIIDQHRAHVRILYERYLEQFSRQNRLSQSVAFPEVVQLPVSDNVKLQVILPEMEQMGFELNDLGAGSYSVTAVPVGLDGLNVVRLVEDMVSTAMEGGSSVVEEINKSLALTLARNAAIPQGQALSNQEMEDIVDKLFTCSNVNYTPDGKSILCILRQQEIEHLLG
ncbi:MAG: DNA mismatch repair endonuclease MutL [Prevotella sp.]|nr:DNA mismatch repair endonuclease MutL [Prevotella sp.]MDD7046409.1 DNA mismatch repair endonuclease MutL [Prevotella sp.]